MDNNQVILTRLEQLRGSIHTNWTRENNSDSNTILIFKGLKKTTRNTRTPKEDGRASNDKERCSIANVF
jgi:hypothetical protein